MSRRQRSAWLPRRLAAAVLVSAVAFGAACSVAEHLAAPVCEGGSSSAIIAVQSVPTATLVPCLGRLPAGWTVARTTVDERGTSVVFDSDRAGAGAAQFHFAASCDTTDAVLAPPGFPGTVRYERIRSVAPNFRGDRFFVFNGGCVWWEFDFEDRAPAALSVELGNVLVMNDRQAVNDMVRETFVDAEL